MWVVLAFLYAYIYEHVSFENYETENVYIW